MRMKLNINDWRTETIHAICACICFVSLVLLTCCVPQEDIEMHCATWRWNAPLVVVYKLLLVYYLFVGLSYVRKIVWYNFTLKIYINNGIEKDTHIHIIGREPERERDPVEKRGRSMSFARFVVVVDVLLASKNRTFYFTDTEYLGNCKSSFCRHHLFADDLVCQY
jgi:hypothetical protein